MQGANQATGTSAGFGVLPKDTHGRAEKELSLQSEICCFTSGILKTGLGGHEDYEFRYDEEALT